MAKGNRFDSMQDIYNKALLERYSLTHYLTALDKFIHRPNPNIFFSKITYATDKVIGDT